MPRIIQTQDELLKHLKEQVSFLERSAASYDNGFEDEAKRLAVAIRILVHDTRKSKSLLTSLGKKEIRFYDSALSYDRTYHRSYSSLTDMRSAGHAPPLDEDGEDFLSALASAKRSKTRRIPFSVWWDGMFVIKDKGKKTFTRKDLVLNTANTDGGAHIDPSLNEAYAKLSRFNSMGWVVVSPKKSRGLWIYSLDDCVDFNNPVMPAIRQIAHETIKTLKDEFPNLLQPNV